MAVASSDEAAAHEGNLQGPDAPQLSGGGGDAVVARRDASVVRQGDHLGTMPDGRDNRCLRPRLGGMVETFRPLRQAQGRSSGVLATFGGGHEQQCSGAGIDPKYKGGSVRMAAASAAIDRGVPIDVVLNTGRWASWQVFNKFYNRSHIRAVAPNIGLTSLA